jgi:hypothetical protein
MITESGRKPSNNCSADTVSPLVAGNRGSRRPIRRRLHVSLFIVLCLPMFMTACMIFNYMWQKYNKSVNKVYFQPQSAYIPSRCICCAKRKNTHSATGAPFGWPVVGTPLNASIIFKRKNIRNSRTNFRYYFLGDLFAFWPANTAALPR